MADRAAGRIRKELKIIVDNQKVDDYLFKLEVVGDDLTKLRGEITGPSGTPYEGLKFVLDITIPSRYPFDPPHIVFATKIWHPNVDSKSGEICLDILKKEWAAVLSLRTVFLSILCIISTPEPNDALNGFAAKQYHRSQELYTRTVRHWGFVYAGGQGRDEEFEEKIKEVKNFGFEEEQALFALSNQNWEIERAAESLLLNDQDLD